jgi:hypothetical protein
VNVFNTSPNPHDEQVIPTMMKKNSNSFMEGTSGGELGEFNAMTETDGSEVLRKSEKLTNEQLNQNEGLIMVFGEETVTKLFSKKW